MNEIEDTDYGWTEKVGARDRVHHEQDPEEGRPLNVTFTSPNGKLQACVKIDGCVDFWIAYNGLNFRTDPEAEAETVTENDIASFHVCDLKEFIQQLNELQEISEYVIED